MAHVVIREAQPDELPAVGELRIRAYAADGFLNPDSDYAPRLRALGTNGDGSVLVAVDDAEPAAPAGALTTTGRGAVIGTIMLFSWPHTGQVVSGSDEAEIRALAVAPGARGRGIGGALVRAVIDRAAGQGARSLILSTERGMRAAHRIYERAGFTRLPHRDWSPAPGTRLLVYGLHLDASASAAR